METINFLDHRPRIANSRPIDGAEEYQEMEADMRFLEMMLESQNISDQRKDLTHPPPWRSRSEPTMFENDNDLFTKPIKSLVVSNDEKKNFAVNLNYDDYQMFDDIVSTDSLKRLLSKTKSSAAVTPPSTTKKVAVPVSSLVETITPQKIAIMSQKPPVLDKIDVDVPCRSSALREQKPTVSPKPEVIESKPINEHLFIQEFETSSPGPKPSLSGNRPSFTSSNASIDHPPAPVPAWISSVPNSSLKDVPTKGDQHENNHADADESLHGLMEKLKLVCSTSNDENEKERICRKILAFPVPLDRKYNIISLSQLLEQNKGQDRIFIPNALKVLEKYALNLLKPPQNRPSSWRSVNLSNQVFQRKVGVLEGANLILSRLGYQEEIRDKTGNIIALKFPDCVKEVDVDLVAIVAADLYLAAHESTAIINEFHPNLKLLFQTQQIPKSYELPSDSEEEWSSCDEEGDTPLKRPAYNDIEHISNAQNGDIPDLDPQPTDYSHARLPNELNLGPRFDSGEPRLELKQYDSQLHYGNKPVSTQTFRENEDAGLQFKRNLHHPEAFNVNINNNNSSNTTWIYSTPINAVVETSNSTSNSYNDVGKTHETGVYANGEVLHKTSNRFTMPDDISDIYNQPVLLPPMVNHNLLANQMLSSSDRETAYGYPAQNLDRERYNSLRKQQWNNDIRLPPDYISDRFSLPFNVFDDERSMQQNNELRRPVFHGQPPSFESKIGPYNGLATTDSVNMYRQDIMPPRRESRVQQPLQVTPAELEFRPPSSQNGSLILAAGPHEPSESSDDPDYWSCKHCTFHNPLNTKVCQMCWRTSWVEKKKPEPELEIIHATYNTEDEPHPNFRAYMLNSNSNFDESHQMKQKRNSSHPNLNQLATQERFYGPPSDPGRHTPESENLRLQVPQDTRRRHRSNPENAYLPNMNGPQLNMDQLAFAHGNNENKSGNIMSPYNQQDVQSNRNSFRGHHTKMMSSQPDPYKSKQPISTLMQRVMMEDQRQNRSMSEYELKKQKELVAQVTREKKHQEDLKRDALEMVAIIRRAESCGFSIEEVQIASTKCKDPLSDIFDWLSVTWPLLGKTAIEGFLEHKIGEISRQEAKEALIACNGDTDKAIKLCVQERQAKIDSLIENENNFGKDDIVNALTNSKGNVKTALLELEKKSLKEIQDRIWHDKEDDTKAFYVRLQDCEIPSDDRTRLVLANFGMKSWGRAHTAIRLMELEENKDLVEDCVEAANSNEAFERAKRYMDHACALCYTRVAMCRVFTHMYCQCELCEDCMREHIEYTVTAQNITNLVCPHCSKPELGAEEERMQHFQHLGHQIKELVRKEKMDGNIYKMFEEKLRDFNLKNDPNFRWCSHCPEYGFVWEDPNRNKMYCTKCRKYTCFSCREKWEDQHEGITCEQFKAWKIENDPERQLHGLTAHLAKHGITCPKCKTTYDLAQGGCIHFKCRNCKYEFCGECFEEFFSGELCKDHPNAGLHAHHPRNCLFYLRDHDVKELQDLLAANSIQFNLDQPDEEAADNKCGFMVQKEEGDRRYDEQCGKEIMEGNPLLCEKHYKEHLLKLFNENHLDPLDIKDQQQVEVILKRHRIEVPAKQSRESDGDYLTRSRAYAKEKIPLRKIGTDEIMIQLQQQQPLLQRQQQLYQEEAVLQQEAVLQEQEAMAADAE